MICRLVVATALGATLVGCAAFHRSSAADACRYEHNPACRRDIAAVTSDCKAGDQESCLTACKLDSTDANCQPSCNQGDGISCYWLAAALSNGQLTASHPLRPDASRTSMLLQKACDAGVGEACFDLVSLSLKDQLPRLAPAQIDEDLEKACAKSISTACFLAAARAFSKGQPASALRPELESGCHPRDPSQSAIEARATSCELLTCLKEHVPGLEAAKARREACAAADSAFTFEFPWASASQPRPIARMPWVLDSANGGLALAALPRGGRWFCFKGTGGLGRCERTQAGCERRKSDLLSHTAPDAPIDACDRGPAVAACFTYKNNGVIEAACTADGGVACPDLRRRISAADPSANPSPCLSVGELF